MVGGPTLCRLAENGRLIPFLQEHKLHGTPMIEKLGGWMKKAMVFRGKKIVTYHKNWVYFARLFGLDVVGEVEPKPAIPPSPKDVEELINTMNTLDVPVVLAANYFDETKIRRITDAVKATPVIVPLSTGGAPGVDTYFDLVDLWIDKLLDAFGEKS
jgi:ABC-type Zn uptake system ZnuABC Zn-binding protein ZnuA